MSKHTEWLVRLSKSEITPVRTSVTSVAACSISARLSRAIRGVSSLQESGRDYRATLSHNPIIDELFTSED